MAHQMKIFWTNSAKKDLHTNYKFLCERIDEQKAYDIIEKLIEKVDVLNAFPLIGQKEPKFEKLKKDYRRLIKGHYKIVYHLNNDGNLYINRVFDSRQHPKKLTIH